MNEANLAIARKVILCAGLLTSAMLFAYPHWRMTVDMSVDMNAGMLAFDQDVGRGFITSPPLQFSDDMFVVRINYVRQITEVALALLLTFGLMRALKLKKHAGDRNHDAAE